MNPITTTVPADGKILLPTEFQNHQVCIFRADDPLSVVYAKAAQEFFGAKHKMIWIHKK